MGSDAVGQLLKWAFLAFVLPALVLMFAPRPYGGYLFIAIVAYAGYNMYIRKISLFLLFGWIFGVGFTALVIERLAEVLR